MFSQKKFLIMFCLISFLGLAVGVKIVNALGQMTQPIVIDNALRGQEVTATLYLINSDEKEATYDLKAEGAIENWASFYKIDDKDLKTSISEILVPPKIYLNVIAKFSVPKDAPNGEYLGEVTISSKPEIKEGENVSASVGMTVGRSVSITVTDKEIIKLETTIIPVNYDMASGAPLRIRLIYDNQGNVAVKPDVQLKISRDGQEIYNVIFPYPESEEAVKPQERKELSAPIEWATAGQANGKYQAEIKILVNGQVAKEDSFRFSVGLFNPASSIFGGLLAAVGNIGRGNMTQGWIIIGIAFLIIAAFVVFIIKGKKIAFLKSK